MDMENSSREMTAYLREVGWRVREFSVAHQMQLKAATAHDMQVCASARSV